MNLGMYSIRDGRGFGIPQAIRTIQMGNYNLMRLTETKVQDVLYCKKRLGYDVT